MKIILEYNLYEILSPKFLEKIQENINCSIYRISHMYSDRQAWANSIDPDETPQNAASHLGLHCLPLMQQFLTQHRVVNCTGSNFKTYMVRSWGVRILRVNTVYPMYRRQQCIPWVGLRWPCQHSLDHVEPVSLPNQYLCTFYCQKLTTAILESALRREWPDKIFHNRSLRKNVARPGRDQTWPPDYYTDTHPSHWGWLDSAECGSWSGSTLLPTHLAVF